MVDGDRLGDLEEADQLQPVQALGAGLVTMDFRQPGVHGRVGRDGAVDVREPEVPPDGVHDRVHGGVHQAGLCELADIELDVGPLDSDQRVKVVGLAPGEPAAQLCPIQGMRGSGVTRQERDRRELRVAHRGRLERQDRP